ncbi:replicative helicase loader/inhibitor [Peptococcaceae bacterium 1198_IL3148]
MTKSEIKVLLQWATANFPNMQERDMRPTAALWEKMLADMPYHVAENALMKVLATAKFFPTVAEIRAAAVEITQPAMPTAAEAWGEVVTAISRYGYYREVEALESLSPTVAQVVRFIGWKDICTSEEPDIIRAQFRKAYETHSAREREMAQIPSDVRQLISSVVKALPSIN